MLLAVVALVLTADPAPVIGQTPWNGAELEPDQRVFYEQHFRAALRRYGLPVDTVAGTEERLGAGPVASCAESWARCVVARGVYRAMVFGEIRSQGGGFRAHYGLISTADGVLIADEEFEAPDARQFLDVELAVAKRLARKSASPLGLDLPVDAPLRGVAIYPMIAGGVMVGVGSYFLIASSSSSSTLKDPGTSLPDATAARSNGSRNLTLGVVLTSLGVASIVMGIVFYAPGAENKPLARLSVDPLGQRIALSGELP